MQMQSYTSHAMVSIFPSESGILVCLNSGNEIFDVARPPPSAAVETLRAFIHPANLNRTCMQTPRPGSPSHQPPATMRLTNISLHVLFFFLALAGAQLQQSINLHWDYIVVGAGKTPRPVRIELPNTYRELTSPGPAGIIRETALTFYTRQPLTSHSQSQVDSLKLEREFSC